ncbi:hypothetical protein ACTA71_004465 [Dictyostelium dimigraforme]
MKIILLLLFLFVLLNISFKTTLANGSYDYSTTPTSTPTTYKRCPNDCTYNQKSCDTMTGVCSCSGRYNINPYDCSDKCSYSGCTKYIDSINQVATIGGPINFNGWFDTDFSRIKITIDDFEDCPVISNSSTIITCLAPAINNGSNSTTSYPIEIKIYDNYHNIMFQSKQLVTYQQNNCLNQCSRLGICDHNGNCNCLPGYFGGDCSLFDSSSSSSSSTSSDDYDGNTIFIEFNPFVMILLFIFILVTIITSKK